MCRIFNFMTLALIVLTVPSCAQEKTPDKKHEPPQYLVDDAAQLTEKGGKEGWKSGDVPLTKTDSKEKLKGQLTMRFKADKDKPGGSLKTGTTKVRVADNDIFISEDAFELVEKDGKRFILLKIRGHKTAVPLEYSIDAGVLTVKGPIVERWGSAHVVDFTNGISFNPTKNK